MWILDNGIWLDVGIWDDADFWQDYPVAGVVVAADGGSYALTGTAAALAVAPAAVSLILAADAGSYALSGTPATLLVAPAELPVFGGGGGIARPSRPHPVEGFGFGILPPLNGEAAGVVAVAGVGDAPLPDLNGAGAGVIGTSGKSRARLAIRAIATGNRGNAGSAIGHIASINAAGIAHHDADEAVALSLLLDA